MSNLVDFVAAFYEAHGAHVHLIYEDADVEKNIIGDASMAYQLVVPMTYVQGTYAIQQSLGENQDGR